MSLNSKKKLIEIAKEVCRELRKKSTEAEKQLWAELRNRNYFERKFYRQYPFYHDYTGRQTFFVADFYCHEEKLIIEVDGKYHNYKLKEDKQRTGILNYLGVRVIRFSNEEVLNGMKKVLDNIEKYFVD